MNKNSNFSEENSADGLDVRSQLARATERIRILSAQSPQAAEQATNQAVEPVAERAANHAAECAAVRAAARAEEGATMVSAQVAAWVVQTAELDDFTVKKSNIDQPPPVKEYDFVAADKHAEAEIKRLSQEMRDRSAKFFKVPKAFKIPKTPKFEKEVKFPPPPRPQQPRPTPSKHYSDDAVIEMVLRPSSGINGVPIYEPKLGPNRYNMKRPPMF